MSAVLLGNETPNTAGWYKLRSQGLGGSEMAAVVGLSPWTSRFTLWHRKAGNIGPQEASESMDWGHRLEPVILDAYAERFPDARVDRGIGTHRHLRRRWQIGNPDAIKYTEKPYTATVVDAKTADKNDAFEWGPDGSDQVPPYYRVQLIHYGDVFEVQHADIALLLGGNDFRVYHLTWTEDEAAWLREEGERFWQSVLDGDEPPLDGSDSTYQSVRELHPDIDGTEIPLDPDDYRAWRDAADAVKEHEQRMKAARAKCAQQMGNARYGTVGDTRVVIRQSKQGGTPFCKLMATKEEA